MENRYQLNITQIQKFLPHRAPFLLVDRVLEIQLGGSLDGEPPCTPVGTRVVAIKNVSFNESYFQGHFPNYPILPGVLIIESMAQTACFSVYPSLENQLEKLAQSFQCILVGVDSARFRRPVIPGDTLRIETEVIKNRGRILQFKCVATVDGQKVAEAEILANIIANSGANAGANSGANSGSNTGTNP